MVVGFAVGSGFGAYTFGTALRRGQGILSLEMLQIAATGVSLALLIGFIQGTSRLKERINTDHLLTTVSAREIVLGIVLAVSSRTAVRMSLTAMSVAAGFAAGVGSPASALPILLAVVGLFILTALLGVGLSFAVELITTRSPRFRRYKNVLIVLAFVLATIGWTVASTELVSLGFSIEWIGGVPTAWFVDLALLGSSTVQADVLRSIGAVALLVVGIPVLPVVTTALSTRVWETEPVSAATLHRSRSLVGEGIAEWLFASQVSRPVLTIARKRWLQERRVPRGLMLPGYLIVLLLGVFFPILAAGEVPGLSLVVLVAICAAATGLAFGMTPIETEYSSLPMTLTSVTGDQFVRGTTLSGVAIGAPITVIATFLLAVGSPLGVLETLLIALTGVVLCTCGVTLAAAIGLRVSYPDLVPVPLSLTSATVYGVIGRESFVKMGVMLGLLGLVCLPALWLSCCLF